MSDTHAVVVRVDGTVELFNRPVSLGELATVLGDVALGAQTIHAPCPPAESLTMLVNDNGHALGAPWNPAATALYYEGGAPVVGDVAIMADHGPMCAEHVAAVVTIGRVVTG